MNSAELAGARLRTGALICDKISKETMDDNEDVINDLLRVSEKELRRSDQQQRLLEDAPTTFGTLASRVRAEIERRKNDDRRTVSRATPERRTRKIDGDNS
jgi:hypothetical protein